jgi:hypothetical protein
LAVSAIVSIRAITKRDFIATSSTISVMRPWRTGAGVLAAAIFLAGVGCAGQTAPTEGSGATPTTTPTPSAPLRADLLTVAEVRPLVAFGYDLREQPALDPATFDVTTLIGPCGARLSTPFARTGTTRVFFSSLARIIEASAAGGAAASELIQKARDDLRAGCPAFADPHDPGAMIALEDPIEVAAVGADRIAWSQTVTGGTRPGHRLVALVGGADRLVLIAVTSSPASANGQFVDLVRLAVVPS